MEVVRVWLALLLGCASLRGDFSYRSRIQVTGGELYDALGALGPRGRDPLIETKLIRGPRLAIQTRQHTRVIDLTAETITEIDFSKKTYSVIPFAEMKKPLEAAQAQGPHESSFKISVEPGATKPFGILSASESRIEITGGSGMVNISVDAWTAPVPGYQQVSEFTARLAEKLGYPYASGFADLALHAPQSLEGLGEAAKALVQAHGAPLQSAIKIVAEGRSLAEISVDLNEFGGGAQAAAKFDPPAGFKKIDATLPKAPEGKSP